MKVKCIKTAINKLNDSVINDDMSNYLSIGSLFEVYGIRFSKNLVYVYIFNDDHLFEVPLEFFEIVDDKVPNELKVKAWNEELTLWPNLFYKEGFLENFAEREVLERALFEDLRVATEQHSKSTNA